MIIEPHCLHTHGIFHSQRTRPIHYNHRSRAAQSRNIDSNGPTRDVGSNKRLTPLSGSMEMLSEDGSYLFLSANPTTEATTFGETFFLDLDYTTQSAEQIIQKTELGRHSNPGNSCIFSRNKDTSRMGCANGFRRGSTRGVIAP